MIAYIILITFVGSVVLAYKLGEISGFRKGFEECDKIHIRNISTISDVLKKCEDTNERNKGNENEK